VREVRGVSVAKRKGGYSELTKAIYSAPSQRYVAERPYWLYSSGPSGDAFEGRYTNLDDAKAAADRIVDRSAPCAYVRKDREIVYKTYAS
jgi:hypothetical protein